MTAAHQAITSAAGEAERLRKVLRKNTSKQVTHGDELQLIRATAHGWFNNHRLTIASALDDHQLQNIDRQYQELLTASGRATSRAKYDADLKQTRRLLLDLESNNVKSLVKATASRTTDAPPQFAPLIADVKMQQILTNRWNECVACVNASAPLAAIVMMGGMLEGLLLAKINQLTDKSVVFKANAAPKDKNANPLQLKDWALKDYLDVAHELIWISRTTKDIGAVVRDYRNYIHPQKEYSHGVSLSNEDARMLWEIAKSIAHQILKP